MLYLIAIALCPMSQPEELCTNAFAPQIVREWTYVATVDDCVQYATKWISAGRTETGQTIDAVGKYARVFCVKAETLDAAYSRIVRWQASP